MIGHDPDRVYTAVVIGAGSGGLTAAIGLAGFERATVLIEAGPIGGDCTNTGCIPSKSFLHAAATGRRDPLGWARSRRDELEAREGEELADDPFVHLVRGRARLTARRDPHVVVVERADGAVEVRAEHAVVATGSRPVEIPIDGLKPGRVLTNENLFDLEELPSSVTILGGGAIALEMATAFTDLAVPVTIVELEDRLLVGEDPLVSDAVRAALQDRGVAVRTGTTIERVDDAADIAHLSDGERIEGLDKVLMAVGRRPRLDGLGLAEAGVEHTSHGIVADDWGRTSAPGIWAIGDVTGNTLTTHGANAIGRRTVRSIAMPRVPMVGSPRAIPTAVYSDPQVASVGLTPDELRRRNPTGRRRYTVDLVDVDRGFTEGVRHGVVVVDVERFTGRILRAAIVGPAAAELIGLFTMAIDHGIGLRKLFGMVHPYPAYAQAVGQLADDFARETYPRLPIEWWAMARARVAARVTRR